MPLDATATTFDSRRFLTLYEAHAPALRTFLFRAPQAERDDLFQEAWVRVQQRWNDFDWSSFNERGFRAWLFEIARNLVIDLARKKRPGAIDDFDRHRDQRQRNPEHTMIESEEAEKLRDCLQKLAEPFQSVARARIKGDSNDEIAARLGVPKETVFTRWHRAVQKLTECVNGK